MEATHRDMEKTEASMEADHARWQAEHEQAAKAPAMTRMPRWRRSTPS